jgi:hypothetical protein
MTKTYEVNFQNGTSGHYRTLRDARIVAGRPGARNIWKIVNGTATLVKPVVTK